MELKTIITILELILLFGFGAIIFGIAFGLMFKIIEIIMDWGS